MLCGVLFDMDGLMFDTERIHMMAWKKAAEDEGVILSDELFYAMRGRGADDCREMFNREIPGEHYDKAREKRKIYTEQWIAEHGVPVKKGLFNLLSYLKEEGIPCSLATSTNRETALSMLESADVKKYFSAFAFGTEVKHTKPYPDIFLKAAELIGQDPKTCVVLEDSVSGLMAARSAGCTPIIVPDLTPAPPESEGLWDYCCLDLDEVIEVFKTLRCHP